MPRKKAKSAELNEEAMENVEEVELSEAVNQALVDAEERVASLRKLYDQMLAEGINSISTLEVKIQQADLAVKALENK